MTKDDPKDDLEQMKRNREFCIMLLDGNDNINQDFIDIYNSYISLIEKIDKYADDLNDENLVTEILDELKFGFKLK